MTYGRIPPRGLRAERARWSQSPARGRECQDDPVRYVIYGAGAVGATIGGRLHQAGHEVVLIARGEHASVMRKVGLRLEAPDRSDLLHIPVVTSPSEISFGPRDVVMLTMKSQDTGAALEALAATAPTTVPIVCAQNGVNNERVVLRQFGNVYGLCVILPSEHLEPGRVRAMVAPVNGILDLGRYPDGVDALTEQIATDLDHCGFSSRAQTAIMRWKYNKLLANLTNALDASCGIAARESRLATMARAEGIACLTAAEIDFASDDEERERRAVLATPASLRTARSSGSSSWQSLARGTGAIEADYLNGEIVALGYRHDVAVPVNKLLQDVANEMARRRELPGTRRVEDLELALAIGQE